MSDKLQRVATSRHIRIGPAGWSYADWRGRVYPENAGTKFDTLALLTEEKVPGPAKLIESYPRLSESVEADDEDEQRSLF
ncbi:MAG: hypothetical protein ACMG6H_07065 [Acidobacteriota bacterium]